MLSSYVMALAICWFIPPFDNYDAPPIARIAIGLSGGSVLELLLAGFACALVSGNIFTAERMDRSAHFLDYLPPTRRQILFSKSLVAVGFTLIVVLVALSTELLAWSLTSYAAIPEENLNQIETVLNFSKLVICVTGVSWAVSSISKSNGAPILLGLFSPLIVLSAIKCIDYFVDFSDSGEMLFARVSNACLLVGVASFVLGCYWFLSQRYES